MMHGVSRRVRDENIGDGSQVREDPNIRRLLSRLEPGEPVGVPLVGILTPDIREATESGVNIMLHGTARNHTVDIRQTKRGRPAQPSRGFP